MQTIKFKKLHPEAKLPEYKTENAVGADVYSVEDVTIPSGKWKIVATGLCYDLPNNLEMQIRSRSGLAANNGIFVLNGIGTLDCDYRGEVKVILANFSDVDYDVKIGDRIGQIVVNEVPLTNFIFVEEISNTERGTGGFGSTGK